MHDQERSTAKVQSHRDAWRSRAGTHWSYWVLAGIILIAAALRLWKLDALPPGLWYDEAINGVDVRMVLGGAGWPAYFTANNGREPLFIYLQTLAVALLGATPYALRIVSALAGILTVPAVYFCARTLFENDPQQPAVGDRARLDVWMALLAAAGLAVSYWHVSLSRLGLRAILLPLVSTLAIAFFYRAWTRRRQRDYAWAGAWMAISLYTYTAARLLPLVPLVFILTELAGALWGARHGRQDLRQTWRRRLRGLAVAAGMMACLCVPLALVIWRNPSVLATRSSAISIFTVSEREMSGTPAQRLLANTAAVARNFYDSGDANPRHNLPGRPANDPLLAALFTLGWLVAVWCIRQPQYRLLLIWLSVMLIPTLLSIEAPHNLRAAGGLPPLVILYAVGAAAMLRLVARPSLRRYAPPALLGVLVLVSGGLAGRDYFMRWATLPKLGSTFSLGDQMAAETMARQLADPALQGQAILVPYQLFVQPQMTFALGLTTPASLPANVSTAGKGAVGFLVEPGFDPRQPLFVVWREAEAVKSAAVEPLSGAEVNALSQAIKQGPPTQVMRSPLHQEGWQTLAMGALPAAVSLQARQIAVPLDVRFTNGIGLMGYDVRPDQLAPDAQAGAFWLTLFWQIEPNTDPRNVSACQAFVHLVDQDAVWEQANGGLAEGYLLSWRIPAVRMVQDIRIVIPPGNAPRGKAHFEVGLFGCEAGLTSDPQERTGIVDGRGQVVADRVDLGAVMIGEAPAQANLAGLRRLSATFDDRIVLIGSQLIHAPAGQLTVDLAWQALARSPTDYTAFVHLIDVGGQIVAQYDQPPGGEVNPTTRWVPGETVRASFPLEPPAGADITGLRLRVGLYEPVSGRQLPLTAVDGSPVGAPGQTYLILPLAE